VRIALVSTSALPTPPRGYGGTELVVAELASGLRARGHEVIVYATGESSCAGELVAHLPSAVWPPDPRVEEAHAAFAFADLSLRQVDVVHVHSPQALPFSVACAAPCFATMHHTRQDKLIDVYQAHPAVHLVGISERQRALHPELSFAGVVHHGLDPTAYDPGEGRGGYAAFVGRFTETKGVHHAIDAALLAGVPLILGGGPQPIEDSETFFLREVQPRIRCNDERVLWLGELRQAAKVSLMRDARATLFPIQWEEPFGLVMIESMLLGTPVIAFEQGAVPEVVEEGVTGFIVRSTDEMAARLRQLEGFDRARCRERAFARWSTERMTADYIALYESVLRSRGTPRRRPASGVADAA
jgi:glycosyltransferase involved in cell wall biosynthesis